MKTSARALRACLVAVFALVAAAAAHAQFGPVNRLFVFVYSTLGTDQITLAGGELFADGRLVLFTIPTPVGPPSVLGLSAAQIAAINGKPVYPGNDWSDTGDTFSNFRRSTEIYFILGTPYYIVSAAPTGMTTISPATRSIVAGGATAQTIAVASTTSWTATASVSWLTITGGASGSGNGTVTYTVAANTTAQARTGAITVAGQNHTITQAAATSPPTSGPPNDAFASRTALAGTSVTIFASNSGATIEAGEPRHAGSAISKSVWWTWTAPASGSVTIDTIGSGFDTLLAVYTGASVSALTLVAENDDRGAADGSSRVTFNATAGIAYQIAVDGFNGASGPITLHVVLASVITTQPVSQAAIPGANVTMSVATSGTVPLSYQWRKDGVNVPGATSGSLTLTNVQPNQAGSYTVVVTTGAGSFTSSAAILTVGNASQAGRLINLSILTSLAAAPNDTFTMGYVVGGVGTSGAKPLVIRAAGPSLGALGVPGTLNDPKIELFAGSRKTGENDNWGGVPSIATAMAGVGAFAYVNASSKDAVAVVDIIAGDNSVKVSASDNGIGAVIAEIYDATPSASFTASTPRLVNVSVLKNIGSSLTAGFVIGGSTSRTVLIRAVGPTLGLAPFNIPGVMADPKIDLFSGQTVIASNDNWGGGSALTSAFASVGAFALPATSKDAALVITLQPGNYTAQVSGVNNTGGLAIVEVYEVP